MDSKGFRLNDHANIIHTPSSWQLNQEVTREIDATKTVPAPDSRYNAYAAPMEDGRLVTDYRQACVSRAPPGSQFAVKQWTIHNTDEIVRISRLRQLQNTGHVLGSANTELPADSYQHCTTEKCHRNSSGNLNGIGIERNEPTPELFGTFSFSPNMHTLSQNKNHLELNRFNEYGRNTTKRWNILYQ